LGRECLSIIGDGLLVAHIKSEETLGLKRIYVAGLVVFVLASLGCAFAPTLPALVSARLIHGAGAAGISVAVLHLCA
jgi:MFS family permease